MTRIICDIRPFVKFVIDLFFSVFLRLRGFLSLYSTGCEALFRGISAAENPLICNISVTTLPDIPAILIDMLHRKKNKR